MNIDKKVIKNYYVIAAKSTLDDAFATKNDHVFYTNSDAVDTAWGKFENATTFNNETLLAMALSASYSKMHGRIGGLAPVPVKVEVSISTIDNSSIRNIILAKQRADALAKLTTVDKEALGLGGKRE